MFVFSLHFPVVTKYAASSCNLLQQQQKTKQALFIEKGVFPPPGGGRSAQTSPAAEGRTLPLATAPALQARGRSRYPRSEASNGLDEAQAAPRGSQQSKGSGSPGVDAAVGACGQNSSRHSSVVMEIDAPTIPISPAHVFSKLIPPSR